MAAQILHNIAFLSIEKHRYRAAASAINSGLALTASPAAARWKPMLLAARAKLALAQDDPPAALRDIELAFAAAHDAATDQSFSAVHLTAYRVYKAVGNDRAALVHLELYQRMEEEGRALAASTNAALMAARFDFANQNARIATLKTGQLTRDVALARLQARQSKVILAGILVLLAIGVVFLVFYLRSLRRNRNEILRASEELAKTNADLGEALLAKSQFLATTSHEIRTPLNGILGMTQVILADRTVGGAIRERIAVVDSAGRAMRTLVDDILDFAKMDSGAVRLDAAPVDLAAMMPDIVALWRVQAAAKGIGLRLTVAGVDRPLVTDAARLRQVVFNLLSNAVKFTAEGAVDVAVAAAEGAVTIAVSDTGIGIPATAFETIFEPFRQLDTSTTRQFGGTGLGLAISRHLARVLGGDITVTSVAGAGSTFTLALPYPATAGALLTPEPVAVALHARLLIATRNPIRRSILRSALAEFGPIAVCDPDEVAGATRRHTAVILLDIDDAAGPAEHDAAFAAIAGLTAPCPPVVVLVPALLADAVAACLPVGTRVLIKPVPADALLPVLRTMLAGGDSTCVTDGAERQVALDGVLP